MILVGLVALAACGGGAEPEGKQTTAQLCQQATEDFLASGLFRCEPTSPACGKDEGNALTLPDGSRHLCYCSNFGFVCVTLTH